MPLPGKSQVSRWRFQVDVALMLWSRKRYAKLIENGTQISAHVLTDGPLQGGKEWLLTEIVS
eukprot:2876966-Pyramimonas_sp.AAC.1